MKGIVIAGPTGVGKTNLSLEIALKTNSEIISADSMQVYKHLDIGTAKIKENETQKFIIWGDDLTNINEGDFNNE